MRKKDQYLSIAVIIAVYFLFIVPKNSPALPSVVKIFEAGHRIIQTPKFYDNALYTLKIVSIGVGISFIAGFIVAVLCSANTILYGAIMPIINSTKNIPSIALYPVFVVLMGIGDLPRVFVIIWNSFYPIISSTMHGLQSVEKELIEAAENCGAGKMRVYLSIKIPLAMIDVLNGLKISMSNGFIAIVVAEMLGATKGLGYMIVWSTNAFKYSDMYFYILIIALIGLTINVVIEKFTKGFERRLFT